MNKNLLTLVLGIAILASSCKKDNMAVPAVDSSLSDLVVPSSFTWQTSRDVNFSIGISDTRFENKLFVVAVYLEDPANGGTPVSKGSASLLAPFNTKISVPAGVNDVYLVKSAPDGTSISQKITLTSQSVSVSLGATASNNVNASASVNENGNKVMGVNNVTSASLSIAATVTDVEPACGTSTTSTTIALSSSKVTCYTGNADAILKITGSGTLKISAPGKTITLNSTSSFSNSKFYIGAGTTLNFVNDYSLQSGMTIINNGNLIASKNLTVYGLIKNNKYFQAGSLTLSAPLLSLSGGILENYCKTEIAGVIDINTFSGIKNYSLITSGSTDIGLLSTLVLYDGAMYQTDTFSANSGSVYGVGTTSLFKVVTTSSTAVSSSGTFSGSIQYCGPKDLNKSRFEDGAVQACGLYIPKDDCNTVGNGTAPVPVKPDTDGDGIIDELDDYPADKTKAFKQYSVNYDNGGSTVAFEDSWPLKGDYDLNDVVLTYKHLQATNAQNVVVHMEGEWNLIATGGEFENGAGVQFPFAKGNITNFTSSNGIAPEAGQDSLVVILFTNSRALQATWNTRTGEPISPTKKFTFSFDVTNGPTTAAKSVSSYNPFIWNNTAKYGRGYETHLYGKEPTKLATATLFGTKDDNSVAGANYSTVTKLPWGIELPISDFKYPVESNSITDTYLKFGSWATSGGTTDKDWFSNTAAGYRNSAKIFASK